MDTLRFPLQFKNGIFPVVIFTPKIYKCPSPIVSDLLKLDKKDSSNNDRVAIYLPGDYSENITSDWGLQDVFQTSAQNILGGAVANIASTLEGRGAKVVSSVESIAGKLPFPTDVAVFKGVAPMTLNFNFNMIPYNEAEGDVIVKIIKNFKKAIMPTIDKELSNILLKFPDVWDIDFTNIRGLGIDKNSYENMALTACNVQLVSGTEAAAVYRDENPTQIKLSLSFQSMMKQFLK